MRTSAQTTLSNMSQRDAIYIKTESRRGALTWLLLLLPFVVFAPPVMPAPYFVDLSLATTELAYLSLACIVCGVAFYRHARRPAPVALPIPQLKLLLVLMSFLVWQALSLARTLNVGLGLRDLSLWVGLWIFLQAGSRAFDARAVVWLQVILAVVAAVLAIGQTVKFADGEMYPNVFFSYGLTAEILATLLPLQLAACLSAEQRWLAVVSGLSAYLDLVALAETLRRGPIVGAALGLALVALVSLTGRQRRQRWQRLAVLVAPLVIVGALFVSGMIRVPNRLAALSNESLGPTLLNVKQRVKDMIFLDLSAPSDAAGRAGPESSSLADRLRFWVVGWEMAKHHPWGGVGLAGYATNYLAYHHYYVEDPRYAKLRRADNGSDEQGINGIAHNEYLQTLAELGWVGLALFLAFWGVLMWLLWRRRRTRPSYLTWGAMAGLLAFAISSAVSSFSFRQVPSTVVVICVITLGTAEWPSHRNPAESLTSASELILHHRLIAAVLCLSLALCGLFAWRAYHTLRGQALQGEADLQFSPTNPAENEAWLEKYRQALTHDPYNAGAHFGCGLLLYQMKRPQEAAARLEAAKRLGYGRTYTNLLLAFAYEQVGRLGQAVELIEENLTAYPESLLAHTVYVEFLRKKGDLEKMRREQEWLERKHAALALAVPLIMRNKPSVAMEEARRLNLPPPYDYFRDPLEKDLLQMRTYHYLP